MRGKPFKKSSTECNEMPFSGKALSSPPVLFPFFLLGGGVHFGWPVGEKVSKLETLGTCTAT